MTTSPQEELRQLLANQLSPSTGSHPRNLFGPDEIPATQVHGAAAETQPYTPVPQEQELLQLRSDLTAFQSTVSAQYNNQLPHGPRLQHCCCLVSQLCFCCCLASQLCCCLDGQIRFCSCRLDGQLCCRLDGQLYSHPTHPYWITKAISSASRYAEL